MVKWIHAKSMLMRQSNPKQWFGVSYQMNAYRGCTHGCIYCDSRSECYGIERFERIEVKKNAPELLERELGSKRSKGTIGTGSMSDPYIPLEKQLKLTRTLLGLLATYQFPVHIITKSDLITRDIDVLKKIHQATFASVAFTITTCRSSIARLIEPQAPSPERRWAALKQLADAGIYTGVLMTPVLPFILEDAQAVEEVIAQAAQNGAQFVLSKFGMTLRDRQREYYYMQLDKHFPGLRARYERTFGNQYDCTANQAQALQSQFHSLCARYGLASHMRDVRTYVPAAPLPKPEQLHLF